MLTPCVMLTVHVTAQPQKPLVTRDRVQLNLAGAEVVLATSRKKAEALGLKETELGAKK